MAQNSDNDGLFGLLQAGLDISLGAAHKSIEMARNPSESASKLLNDMVSMLTVPPNAGPELQHKAQAIAGVWMEKGMTLLAECKSAGEKYKEGARPSRES
jgi:hypothetical protein